MLLTSLLLLLLLLVVLLLLIIYDQVRGLMEVPVSLGLGLLQGE